jgi:hypothetical protein
MMQVLEAGGMPILTDGVRCADEDNPRGYYEFEPVKNTARDSRWLAQATGKAVKMVYRLLRDLPREYEYRVIFMRRKVDEVLVSQKIMLTRSNRDGSDVPDERMAAIFEKDVAATCHWIEAQDNFRLLAVDYGEMIRSPLPECQRISGFLGGGFDAARMASAVDPALYRNKS